MTHKLFFGSLLMCICLFSTRSFSQVGINTKTPKSMLDINGNISYSVINLTGTNTGGSGTAAIINDGYYISINPQQTDDMFRLPNAVDVPGRTYIIRNINNSTTAKLISDGGDFFPKNSSGGSTQIFMYEGNNRTVIVISDGVNWTYIN